MGQQFGAQLALNSHKTSLKRAASAGPGSASNLPKRSKFITELVSSLGGSMPGGHGGEDEMDPLGLDGDASLSLGHGVPRRGLAVPQGAWCRRQFSRRAPRVGS